MLYAIQGYKLNYLIDFYSVEEDERDRAAALNKY
jgi:hypothetical protein